MDQEKKKQLEKAGIAVDEVLERVMGNELLLERFLKKFLEDPNYEKLTKALESGDQESALGASHTLKGVCGNLSMRGLHESLGCQVKEMRSGQWQEAKDRMPEIERMYKAVYATLQEIFGGGCRISDKT